MTARPQEPVALHRDVLRTLRREAALGLLYPRRCPLCGEVLGFAADHPACRPVYERLLRKQKRLSPAGYYLGGLAGAAAVFSYEDEIRAATKAVFSPAMCEMLYEIAFSGVSTEDESKVAFARYIQQGDYLTVRTGLDTNAVDVGRTYDFAKMTVLIDEAERIRVEVPSEVDGKPSVNVRITLIKTENGWRLDSPTY